MTLTLRDFGFNLSIPLVPGQAPQHYPVEGYILIVTKGDANARIRFKELEKFVGESSIPALTSMSWGVPFEEFWVEYTGAGTPTLEVIVVHVGPALHALRVAFIQGIVSLAGPVTALPVPASGVSGGVETVPGIPVAVQFNGGISLVCKSISIQAPITNVGLMFVGDATVENTAGGQNFPAYAPGQNLDLDAIDVASLYSIGDVVADVLTWIVELP